MPPNPTVCLAPSPDTAPAAESLNAFPIADEVPELATVLREILAELRRQREPEPELLNAAEAARLCGVAEASWYRLRSAGKTPAPVRLSGSVRWRRRELLAWFDAGCPDRKKWETTQAGNHTGHPRGALSAAANAKGGPG